MQEYEEMVVLSLLGIVIGAVVGLVEVLFGKGLEWVLHLHNLWMPWILAGLPFGGLLLVWLFQKYGQISRKGINLVFEVSQGITLKIPKRTVYMMVFATWISNLFGASVGREGVAIQIGATISHVIGRNIPWLRQKKGIRTIFLVTGMAAGFAGLFGTPFTAAFFALEVLVAGTLKYRALPSALSAAFTASYVSSLLGIHKQIHYFEYDLTFNLMHWGWKLLILGIVFGIAGGLFAWCLKKCKAWISKKVENPYKRIFFGGVLLALLLMIFYQGRYCCLGDPLIAASFDNGTIYPWDWVLKFVFTIFSLSIGFIGGEVTPLFAIGASLGFVLGPVLGITPMFCAALGYAALFGAGTNTWLAPMMIGMEIFGFAYFPFFFIVCSVSYIMNRNQSIYALQKRTEEAF